jgi:hypothetical protein
MGPFGLTLFDLSVTPDAVRTAYLHPSLSGIGGVDREVGRCVRAIWVACLGLACSREQGGGMNDDIVREPHTEYRFTAGRLVLGTSGTWSATFSEERPWPRNIFFQSQSPAYTVRIKQIDDASLERARQ